MPYLIVVRLVILFFSSRQFARIIEKQQEYLDSRDNGK